MLLCNLSGCRPKSVVWAAIGNVKTRAGYAKKGRFFCSGRTFLFLQIESRCNPGTRRLAVFLQLALNFLYYGSMPIEIFGILEDDPQREQEDGLLQL